jgi:flagellar hook-associated protein 2
MANVGASLGAGSGLALDELLSRLVTAEAQPLVALKAKEAAGTAKISAYGQFSAALTAFNDALKALTSSKFGAPKVASSDSTIGTIVAADGTKPQTVELEVKALAKAAKVSSAAIKATDGTTATATSVIGAGTLTFKFGNFGTPDAPTAFTADPDQSDFVVTIDPAKNTLADIRDAINAADGPVTASLVNDGGGARLVYTSKETGKNTNFSITATDSSPVTPPAAGLAQLSFNPDAPGSANQSVKGANAAFTLDGVSIDSKTNSNTTAIDGLTINLAKIGTTTLSVTADSSSAKTALQAVATKYNALLTLSKTITLSVPQDAGSSDTRTDGPLSGDSTIRTIMNEVKNQIATPLAGADAPYNSFASIGLGFAKDFTLTLDETVYNKAISDDAASVKKLFTPSAYGANSVSLAKRISDRLDQYVADDGVIDNRTDGLAATNKSLQKQQANLQLRVAAIEARYRAQFTALDTMLTSLGSTSSFLSQQLDALASLRQSK